MEFFYKDTNLTKKQEELIEKNALARKLFNQNNKVYTEEEIQKIERGLNFIKEFCKSDEKIASLDIYKLIDFYDVRLVIELDNFLNEFVKNLRLSNENKNLIIEKVLNESLVVNKQIINESKRFFEIVRAITSTKEQLNKFYSNKEINDLSQQELTDITFFNFVNNLKNYWDSYNHKNLSGVLDYLHNEVDLSYVEIVKLSQKCSTIFINSNKEKIDKVSKIIENFKSIIVDKINAEELTEDSKALLDKINNYKFKNIITRCASIGNATPATLNAIVEMFNGKTIETLLQERTIKFNDSKIINLAEKYKDFKLEPTIENMEFLLFDKISALTITPKACLNVLDSLNNGLKLQNPKHQTDLKLVNAKNIADLSSVPYEKLEARIKSVMSILSNIMHYEDISNYLKQDLSIFTVDSSVIKSKLLDCFYNAKNEQDVNKNIETLLKKGFYPEQHYDGDINKLILPPIPMKKQSDITKNTSIKISIPNMDSFIEMLDNFSINTNNIVTEKDKEETSKEVTNDNGQNLQADIDKIEKEIEFYKEFMAADDLNNKFAILLNTYAEVKEKYSRLINDLSEFEVPENFMSSTGFQVNEFIQNFTEIFKPDYLDLKRSHNQLTMATQQILQIFEENNDPRRFNIYQLKEQLSKDEQSLNIAKTTIAKKITKSFIETRKINEEFFKKYPNSCNIIKNEALEQLHKSIKAMEDKKELNCKKIESLNKKLEEINAERENDKVLNTLSEKLVEAQKAIFETIARALLKICSQSIFVENDFISNLLFDNHLAQKFDIETEENLKPEDTLKVLKCKQNLLKKSPNLLDKSLIGIKCHYDPDPYIRIDHLFDLIDQNKEDVAEQEIDNLLKIINPNFNKAGLSSEFLKACDSFSQDIKNIKQDQSVLITAIKVYLKNIESYTKKEDVIKEQIRLLENENKRLTDNISSQNNMLKNIKTTEEYEMDRINYINTNQNLNTIYDTIPEMFIEKHKMSPNYNIPKKR